MTFDEIQKLVAWAKEQGLKSLKVDGLCFEFGDIQPVVVPQDIEQDPKAAASFLEDQLSDEDALFWSADGPLPSEIRQAQAEANKEPA